MPTVGHINVTCNFNLPQLYPECSKKAMARRSKFGAKAEHDGASATGGAVLKVEKCCQNIESTNRQHS